MLGLLKCIQKAIEIEIDNFPIPSISEWCQWTDKHTAAKNPSICSCFASAPVTHLLCIFLRIHKCDIETLTQ